MYDHQNRSDYSKPNVRSGSLDANKELSNHKDTATANGSFGRYIKEASYCANSGGVGDTITVVSNGVEYYGANGSKNAASPDPTASSVSGEKINDRVAIGGAIGNKKTPYRSVAHIDAGGSASDNSDPWSAETIQSERKSAVTNGAANGAQRGSYRGDTVGRTQEKLDMKTKSRADVNKLYGGTDKDSETSDPPSVTLRGGFISDGDVFGTGQDRKTHSGDIKKGAQKISSKEITDPFEKESGSGGNSLDKKAKNTASKDSSSAPANQNNARVGRWNVSFDRSGLVNGTEGTNKHEGLSDTEEAVDTGVNNNKKGKVSFVMNNTKNSKFGATGAIKSNQNETSGRSENSQNDATRNSESYHNSTDTNERLDNKALGNSDFSSYGDFCTANSSAEWHNTCDTDPLSNDESNKEDDENEQTSAPKNHENNKKNDKTIVTGNDERQIKTIVIAGQIEGHSQLPQGQKATRYEELIPELVEIEESDKIGGLLLILNTVGGDVEAGLALSELIAGMKKPTASLVLGGGHSIGVPLAVSAKRSFIAPSATMTLHPVRITGMILGAPQTYVYLNKMQERIIDFTCNHCEMTPERFNELMLGRDEMSTDLGSVLDGRQAVDEGLIDALGTLSDAITFIKEAMADS